MHGNFYFNHNTAATVKPVKYANDDNKLGGPKMHNTICTGAGSVIKKIVMMMMIMVMMMMMMTMTMIMMFRQ
jgi:hypothetical protein